MDIRFLYSKIDNLNCVIFVASLSIEETKITSGKRARNGKIEGRGEETGRDGEGEE